MLKLLNQTSIWKSYFQRLVLTLIPLVVATQLWMMVPASATGVYQMPDLVVGDRTWIFDEANLLSRITKGKISGDLEKLAKETGNEVRMVTLHRLDYGETPESFANQLFERWFPTSAAQANQVLLVLDDVTNGVAIRTGDGVKSTLRDEIAESVTQETMFAPLRDNNKYNQAFMDASDRLIAVLSGKPDPGPPVIDETIQVEGTFATAEETEKERGSATVVVVVLLLAATIIPMATYYLYQVIQGG